MAAPQQMTPEDLAARMAPPEDFLEPEALKKEVIKAVEPPVPEKEKVDTKDPRAQKVFTFKLNYTDGAGKVWKGLFTNQILSIRNQQLVGIMRARMAGSVPFQALDPLTAEINFIVAHMSFSLTDRPDWAKDLTLLDDVRLLQAIYAEVASHEAYFFERQDNSGESKEGA